MGNVESDITKLEEYDSVMVTADKPWAIVAGAKDFLEIGAWVEQAEFMVLGFDDFGNVSLSFDANGLGEEYFYVIHRDCLKIVEPA